MLKNVVKMAALAKVKVSLCPVIYIFYRLPKSMSEMFDIKLSWAGLRSFRLRKRSFERIRSFLNFRGKTFNYENNFFLFFKLSLFLLDLLYKRVSCDETFLTIFYVRLNFWFFSKICVCLCEILPAISRLESDFKIF